MLVLLLKKCMTRLVRGDQPFHEEGDVDSSCLTFLHGDSQPLDRRLSNMREKGSKIELFWSFFEKHNEHAKDQLVLQVAFRGGGALTGNVFSYTTSQLSYALRNGNGYFFFFLVLSRSIVCLQ